MVDCTEGLRAEHEDVLAMLDVVEAMEDRFEHGRPVPAEDMRTALDSLETFVDRCHLGMEEELLFPAVRTRLPESKDTLARLEGEHERARRLVARVDEGVDRLDAGDISAGRELAEDLHAYGDLLHRHIELEDDVLYPMVLDALSPEEQQRLAEGYARADRNESGESRHEAFHETVGRLRADYVERTQPLNSG